MARDRVGRVLALERRRARAVALALALADRRVVGRRALGARALGRIALVRLGDDALVVARVHVGDAVGVDVALRVRAHRALVLALVALPLGRLVAAVDTRVDVGRALARLAGEDALVGGRAGADVALDARVRLQLAQAEPLLTI